MGIPQFKSTDALSDITAALGQAGCAVVTDVFDAAHREQIKTELAPFMSETPVDQDQPEEFYPGQTRRITALLARSPGVAEHLLLNPISTAACEAHVLPNSKHGYQLHVSAALEVGPGAREQVLHREEDAFDFFTVPRPNLIVASMWAVSDFRADNGATLLVPGSHTWPADRKATPDEIVSAEMPAGSVLFWLGGLLHGAGANTADDWRYGIILTYSAGWVRQEENQYLDIPQSRLAELTEDAKRVAGFNVYGDVLGIHDPRVA